MTFKQAPVMRATRKRNPWLSLLLLSPVLAMLCGVAAALIRA